MISYQSMLSEFKKNLSAFNTSMHWEWAWHQVLLMKTRWGDASCASIRELAALKESHLLSNWGYPHMKVSVFRRNTRAMDKICKSLSMKSIFLPHVQSFPLPFYDIYQDLKWEKKPYSFWLFRARVYFKMWIHIFWAGIELTDLIYSGLCMQKKDGPTGRM